MWYSSIFRKIPPPPDLIPVLRPDNARKNPHPSAPSCLEPPPPGLTLVEMSSPLRKPIANAVWLKPD